MPEPHSSDTPDAATAPRRPGFDAQVARAQDALRAFAGRLLGRTHLAQEIDDVVQETLTRALRSAHTHDEGRPLEPWLCGICVRVAADRHRARQAARLWTEPLDAAGTRAAEPTERGGHFAVDARDELARRLAVLGRRERTALVAFHRDGWSVARIAGALGVPAGTVKSLLSRARRALAAEGATRDATHGRGPGSDDA